MPALRAIVSVEVPSRPCSPNSSSATAMISSRRTSAVLRVLVAAFTRWKLSLTHNKRKWLPAARRAAQVLRVAPQRRGRGQHLVDEQVAGEPANVPAHLDAEAAEHVAFLPAAKEPEDQERDREQEHRPPAEDQRVAEQEEDHSGHPKEDQPDVQEWHEVVDPRDELREHARLPRRRVRA